MSSELARIRSVYNQRIEEGVFDRYSLLRRGELYMLQRREEETLKLFAKAAIDPAKVRVLEIGCGRGQRLLDWLRWGAAAENLYGVDLMESFVEEARKLLPSAHLAAGSADALPFPDAHFDIVMQSTVFTSILDPELKQRIAAEMARVLKPDGAILWYDFRYPVPWNKAVKPIALPEIRDLFSTMSVSTKHITLLPPLARRLARVSFILCRLLETIPPLCSHTLALIKRGR